VNQQDERDFDEERANQALMTEEHDDVFDQDAEPKADWYFTFGVGHKLISVCDDVAVSTHQVGISLKGKYVKINGTYDEARLEMCRRWGNAWASQYSEDRFPELVAKYQYVELTGLV